MMNIPTHAIKSGFEKVIENTSFSGRWQILREEPKVICDTAHNEDGLSYVMKQLAHSLGERLSNANLVVRNF